MYCFKFYRKYLVRFCFTFLSSMFVSVVSLHFSYKRNIHSWNKTALGNFYYFSPQQLIWDFQVVSIRSPFELILKVPCNSCLQLLCCLKIKLLNIVFILWETFQTSGKLSGRQFSLVSVGLTDVLLWGTKGAAFVLLIQWTSMQLFPLWWFSEGNMTNRQHTEIPLWFLLERFKHLLERDFNLHHRVF